MDNGECDIQRSNLYRLHMSDDVELYSRTNDVAIRDATHLLEEYSSKFQWKKNARVIDIGSGDGTVTKILSTYLPSDYEVLVGADMKEKSIQYANSNHKDDKIKFVTINIEGEIPDDMKDSFEHLFSFYTFHWVKEQEKAFTNVYNLLSENGECLVVFLGYCQVYSVFYSLYKSEKWGKLLKDFDKFPSPYWYFRDPDAAITKMLKKIGYRRVDVRCKQMTHIYNDIEHMKRLISVISPFDIPKNLIPGFLDDLIEVFRTMKLIDEESGTITIIYNLLVVHCTK